MRNDAARRLTRENGRATMQAMQDGDRAAPGQTGARSTDVTLRLLLEQLLPELRELIDSRENFRLTIHASAGHEFQFETLRKVRIEL